MCQKVLNVVVSGEIGNHSMSQFVKDVFNTEGCETKTNKTTVKGPTPAPQPPNSDL